MKRRFLAIILIICAFPAFLSARSPIDLSLGFGGTFTNQQDVSFSEGIQNPENWMFGGEVAVRLSFLQAQAMAFPMECEDNGQGVLLLGFASLNLPVVGSLLFLELGVGPSVTYVPSTKDNGGAYYILKDGSTPSAYELPFLEAVKKSPLYVQFGLGVGLGKVDLRVRYFLQSMATLQSFSESWSPLDLFQLQSGSLSLALSLKMF